MRAVVYSAPGSVEVKDVPEPSLVAPSDAIVKISRAGICGTDLHLLSDGHGLTPGQIMGHEFVGTVVATGASVTSLASGDRVAGADFVACGACRWCRDGCQWECEQRRFFGTGTAFGPPLEGVQAEFVQVPFADVALQKLPGGIGWDDALFLGDILATGYSAVRRASFRPGATVAVVGGGPVGQMAAQCAQACGAGPVVVIEPLAERRALAEKTGSLSVEPDAARDLINGLTDGRGADAAIEAVGGLKGLEVGLGALRRRGTLVSVGVQSSDTWNMPVAQAFVDELTVSFAVGNAIRDRDELTDLLRAGLLEPNVIIDKRLSIDDAADGYQAMIERSCVKAVVSF